MTQEEEAKDLLNNFCGAHDETIDEHTLRLIKWFNNWKDNPPDLGVSVSEEIVTEESIS